MFMRARKLAVSSLLTLGLFAAAPAAEACTYVTGVLGLSPSEEVSTWPEGTPIYILAVDEVTLESGGAPLYEVTVDGEPASLVLADNATPTSWDKVKVQVEPLPVAGQVVDLRGTFCEGCTEEFARHFTVGPADTEGPAGEAPWLWFDLHDHSDEMFPTNCGGYAGEPFTWSFHVEGLPPYSEESPYIYTLTAFRSDDLTTEVTRWNFTPWDTTMDVPLGGEDTLVVSDLPEAYCFRVDTFDLAGNPGPSSNVACAPCHYRVDNSVDYPVESFKAWEIYPGGACADGAVNPGGPEACATADCAGASGDDPIRIEGCQCSTGVGAAATGSGMAWLGALPFAAWLARRRRSEGRRAR
ncbi:Hypothetical protein CAP_8132 [Chondromyces apiculatus DSM 436]|uniref:Lipoprotein n=2 Tax=Chondromyces apiculatus TaxID=51 RepID=A0A017TGC5_9BACT|nr:Hypothetical protein CAP_8132 [Chondromyces apiculatus DSM 436]